jgi:hypothetical protein
LTANLAASIHARLLNRAKARGEEFNLVLTRYAVERFLYRMSIMPARENYCLKGALLFDLWFEIPHRPTHDADFLGFGPMDAEALAATMHEICGVTADDGMIFDATSIMVEEIREEARYGGLRVRLVGNLGKARSTVQLDAIAATFQRRGTPLPETEPFGLSDEFATDTNKRAQWKAFLGKNRLDEIALEEVIKKIRQFVGLPMAHARLKQKRL